MIYHKWALVTGHETNEAACAALSNYLTKFARIAIAMA